MQLYFGYGSNMDAAQMRDRCPGATLLGIAVLKDHRLLITEDGYATVVAHEGGRVMGALWTLTEQDERALDDYEGIATGFYRRASARVESDGQEVNALIYVAASTTPGRPRPGYLELVVAAARSLGLPAEYIAELARTA